MESGTHPNPNSDSRLSKYFGKFSDTTHIPKHNLRPEDGLKKASSINRENPIHYTSNQTPNKLEEEQIHKYNEHTKVLNYLKYMDWESINPLIHKTSPINNPPMTSICYWFWVCSSYFPKRDIGFLISHLHKVIETSTKKIHPLKLNLSFDGGKGLGGGWLGKTQDFFLEALHEYGQHSEEHLGM
jgi:hypothetical protein